jgi:hypothetical protein
MSLSISSYTHRHTHTHIRYTNTHTHIIQVLSLSHTSYIYIHAYNTCNNNTIHTHTCSPLRAFSPPAGVCNATSSAPTGMGTGADIISRHRMARRALLSMMPTLSLAHTTAVSSARHKGCGFGLEG